MMIVCCFLHFDRDLVFTTAHLFTRLLRTVLQFLSSVAIDDIEKLVSFLLPTTALDLADRRKVTDSIIIKVFLCILNKNIK